MSIFSTSSARSFSVTASIIVVSPTTGMPAVLGCLFSCPGVVSNSVALVVSSTSEAEISTSFSLATKVVMLLDFASNVKEGSVKVSVVATLSNAVVVVSISQILLSKVVVFSGITSTMESSSELTSVVVDISPGVAVKLSDCSTTASLVFGCSGKVFSSVASSCVVRSSRSAAVVVPIFSSVSSDESSSTTDLWLKTSSLGAVGGRSAKACSVEKSLGPVSRVVSSTFTSSMVVGFSVDGFFVVRSSAVASVVNT